MDTDTPKTTSALPADGSSMTPSERPPSRLTYEHFEDEINAAPLHLHAIRTPARLQGNTSLNSITKANMPRSRSSSRSRTSSRNTSRDTSPCPSDIAGGIILTRVSSTNSSIAGDLDSSITSGGVQINIDPDILLDRMGMDASPTMNDSLSGSITFLPCLNERMSEESLDDCHAFTDLRNVIRQIPSASAGSGGGDPARSRDGSVAGGSILGDASCLLETLEEFEEESDGGDEINASSECEDNHGIDEIQAFGNMSLNATNVNKLDVTCKEIEVENTERIHKSD